MSGVQIGSLHVSLSADSAVFEKGMDSAAKKADDTFGKVVDGAKQMAGLLAAAVSIDFMANAIKQQMDYADALSDVAARTFQTTEQLSAMEYALHFSDATLEDYTAGLQKLSVNMVAAGEGAKAQAEMFSRLGISLYEQDGRLRDTGAVMLDLSDKLAGMQDGAQKTALVMEILGKSAGPQLLPHLNQGSQGIRDLTAEAERMGLVISTQASAQAGALNDNIDKLKFAAQGAARQFGVGLTPALVDVTGHMLKATENANKFATAGRAMGQVVGAIYYGLSGLSIMAGKVADGFGKLLALDEAMLRLDWEQFKNIWNDNGAREKALKDLQDLQDWYKKFQDGSGQPPAAPPAAPPPPPPPALTGLPGLNKANTPEKLEQQGIDAAFKEYSQRVDAERAFQAEVAAIRKGEEEAAAAEESAKQAGIDAAFEEYSQKLDAERAYLAEVSQLRQRAVDEEIRGRELAANFITGNLNQLGQKHKAYAKAAEAISKVTALRQIASDTPVAAVAAAKAVAGIPIVGPTLAPLASAAMYALGGVAAANVMSGSSTTASPGGVPAAMANTSDVTSRADQRQAETPSNNTAYFRIPENAILTGRAIIDLVNEALGDGKQFNSVRFIPE